MKSPVVKRSIVIAGHKTSVSLEDAFWKGLKEIADSHELTLSEQVAAIDTDRRHGNRGAHDGSTQETARDNRSLRHHREPHSPFRLDQAIA